MRLWVFILFGLCFLFASSVTSGKFMPRSSRDRTIAIVLMSFLVVLAAWAIWQLLPYYEQPKREQERRAANLADNRATNAVVLSGLAQQAHADTELAKKGQVRVGMITEQCRIAWGEPDHINRTIDARGEHEKWVYGGGHYLYFDDEVLISIEGIGRPERLPAEVKPSVTHFAVATPTPVRDPDVVTITKPISIAVRYGSVSVASGTKLPFVSRAGEGSRPLLRRRRLQYPISATDLK
jgi:membrane protein implicated in regulation of membrane protease activity